MKAIIQTKRIFSAIMLLAMCIGSALACTSMLVSAGASASGRPLMWKHRDTGAESNFIDRVEARDGLQGYVALFDEGDSLRTQAWMGMNDSGFAIMNTASYNLAPDTAAYKDMEGVLMKHALERCTTVADFESMLLSMPKPMGIQANFGVMDKDGGLAYFEADDYGYTRFDVSDTHEGYMIRTNHSMTGGEEGGMGYIRFENVKCILADELSEGRLSPQSFTEVASRSFYHSLLGRDCAADGSRWVVDQDFIPRYISTASIVIEGGSDPDEWVMWAALGYPPCAVATPVQLHSVPDYVKPRAETGLCPAYEESLVLKRMAFPISRGNGHHYIDMDFLRTAVPRCHERSVGNYESFRSAGNNCATRAKCE